MKKETSSALFPLSVNILPGAYLPLQIFEPRYIDMVSECLANSEGFCIVLFTVDDSDIDTMMDLADEYDIDIEVEVNQKDILLGKIERINEEDDNLSNEPEYLDLWNMVKEITNHPEIKKLNLDLDLNSSISVCYILASVLPLRPQEKQTILEFDNNRDKLDYLKVLIKRLGG